MPCYQTFLGTNFNVTRDPNIQHKQWVVHTQPYKKIKLFSKIIIDFKLSLHLIL